jgi:hypothetical protein
MLDGEMRSNGSMGWRQFASGRYIEREIVKINVAISIYYVISYTKYEKLLLLSAKCTRLGAAGNWREP